MSFFYDNNVDHIAVSGANVAVERVYCIRSGDFVDNDWSKLDAAYRSLPGWIDYLDGIPHWFGPQGAIPSLSASVEPSGLIVSGTVPVQVWESWHATFSREIAGLPMFEA